MGQDTIAMLASTSEWIRGADAKAAILASALLAVLGITTSRKPTVGAVWPGGEPATPHSWTQFGALLLGSVALALLTTVVFPRTRTPQPNRFSWPWLARAREDELHGVVCEIRQARAEGWQQVATLARIAQRKHYWLRWAIIAWVGSVFAVGVDLMIPA